MAVRSQDVFRVMSALGYDDAKVACSSEPPVLLIGDPSSLYVCGDAALASEPEPWMGTCDEGCCPIGAYIADHIVTGSAAGEER